MDDGEFESHDMAKLLVIAFATSVASFLLFWLLEKLT